MKASAAQRSCSERGLAFWLQDFLGRTVLFEHRGVCGPSPSRLRCQRHWCVQAAKPGCAADLDPVRVKQRALPGQLAGVFRRWEGRSLWSLSGSIRHGCRHVGRPAQAGWWQGRSPLKGAISLGPARLVGKRWFDQRKQCR